MTVFCRYPKALLAGICLHFSIGLLCLVPGTSPIRGIPVIAGILAAYEDFGFTQGWKMFSQISKARTHIGYSLKSATGWAPLLDLDEIPRSSLAGRLWVPQGVMRLSVHLRYSMGWIA